MTLKILRSVCFYCSKLLVAREYKDEMNMLLNLNSRARFKYVQS